MVAGSLTREKINKNRQQDKTSDPRSACLSQADPAEKLINNNRKTDQNCQICWPAQTSLFQRSLSPNTGSSADSTAVVSASMWPFIMKSSAWRWLNIVGRILQR